MQKGCHTVSHTVCFNGRGTFNLPPIRGEAMYAPKRFAERPNPALKID
jgi:uncharacterized protein YfaS (alpha-2-macroglobulin family)